MKHLALVVAGGTAGTLARHGVGEWLDPDRVIPLGTFVVNVTGSFLLGALLAVLLLRDRDDHRRRDGRLLLGTGFLGGYTTYSALAVETGTLLRDDRVALALTYAAGSVAAGLLAALVGIATGRWATR
ncbi:MAG: CrcB family protein [Aeromicrobium sp.]